MSRWRCEDRIEKEIERNMKEGSFKWKWKGLAIEIEIQGIIKEETYR